MLVATVGIEQELFEYHSSMPKGTLCGLWLAYWLLSVQHNINGNSIGDGY
jgi:hypothetical protein